MDTEPDPLSRGQRFLKRSFDIVASALGLLLFGWLIAIAWLVASLETRRNGFFVQSRVGRHGRMFPLVKIRTMRDIEGMTSTVTTRTDPRITRSGRLLRRLKLDELPQLWNVLAGHMSFVGPRPDVEGFADQLAGKDRVVLKLRPGITGPATLAFRDEEALLASQEDPDRFNREVVFPAKVRINCEYARSYTFAADLKWIYWTITGKRLRLDDETSQKLLQPSANDR